MLDLSLPSGLRDLLPDHSAHLAELSGELDFALASCLADLYGTTTDCLAGRRPDRRQQSSLSVVPR